MVRKKGFTLVEMILVVIVASAIITVIYKLLELLPRVKGFNDARQTVIQETNDVMDKFAIMFQDYSVDYEEYFNRRTVGCTDLNKRGNSFEWSIPQDGNLGGSGHCTLWTYYGNGSNGKHDIKYNLTDFHGGGSGVSYGEYKASFWDYGTDTDDKSIGAQPIYVGDVDDKNLGMNDTNAIEDDKNIKELYLISHDESRRLFLRRTFKPYTIEKNGATNIHGASGYATIQILRLRGFDAGEHHKFGSGTNAENDSGVYDGWIDTWACDRSQLFECTGSSVNELLYPGYNLPNDIDDGWVDLFDEKVNVLDRNIQIAPLKNPNRAWTELDQQINPYIRISLTVGLSDHLASNTQWGGTGFQYTLETLYNTKEFYTD